LPAQNPGRAPELFIPPFVDATHESTRRQIPMNAIIYLVGLVVVVMAILSFFGLS
jgi:hypothetical protein